MSCDLVNWSICNPLCYCGHTLSLFSFHFFFFFGDLGDGLCKIPLLSFSFIFLKLVQLYKLLFRTFSFSVWNSSLSGVRVPIFSPSFSFSTFSYAISIGLWFPWSVTGCSRLNKPLAINETVNSAEKYVVYTGKGTRGQEKKSGALE